MVCLTIYGCLLLRDVPPQYSQQFVAGYNQSFNENAFEGSVEFYYKKMDDLITYAEGSNILGTDFSSWEDRVEINGLGKSYGLELFLKKNKGKLTGWVGYTLSRSIRQFDRINLGRENILINSIAHMIYPSFLLIS